YAKYVENNSADAYSRCVVDYSEAWANLMESRMRADGAKIADIATETSDEANQQYGITGFMYGCAVSGLSHFWQYGDDLRKWHNREYIKDEAKADEVSAEGKTVNPAIITVG